MRTYTTHAMGIQYDSESANATGFLTVEIVIPYKGISALVIPRCHMVNFMVDFGTKSHLNRSEVLAKGGYTNKTPCLRINGGKSIKRTDAIEWAKAHEGAYMIDNIGGRGYTHNMMREDAKTKGFPNAGVFFEVLIAERLGWNNIGSMDRQSHTRHSDNQSRHTGVQMECKLYTGFFTLQYDRDWDWADE